MLSGSGRISVLFLLGMRNLLNRMRRLRQSFPSIGAVVGELQLHSQIFSPQQSDDGL